MKFVYLLTHSHECKDDPFADDFKILGAYTSADNAKEAIERYFKLEGFSRYPKDCFSVDKYKLDADTNWIEGFVSIEEAEEYRQANNLCNTSEYKTPIDLKSDK